MLLQPIEDVDPLVRALWTYGAKGDAKAAIDKEIAEFMSAQYAERVMALAERYGIYPRRWNPPAFVYTLRFGWLKSLLMVSELRPAETTGQTKKDR